MVTLNTKDESKYFSMQTILNTEEQLQEQLGIANQKVYDPETMQMCEDNTQEEQDRTTLLEYQAT